MALEQEFRGAFEEGMALCEAKEGSRAAAIAISDGEYYLGSLFPSTTRLLTLGSEVVSLVQAARFQDYTIDRVVAQYENVDRRQDVATPSTIEALIDFSLRTGRSIGYTALDGRGDVLCDADDVTQLVPFYKPGIVFSPDYVQNAERKPHKELETPLENPTDTELKNLAIEALDLAMPQADNNSRYGAVVATSKGGIYLAGQMSMLGGRTIHAEMSVMVAAKMNRDTEIVELGLVSTKFTETPASMCGCCRQFIADNVTSVSPTITHYALDANVRSSDYLSNLLPDVWRVG